MIYLKLGYIPYKYTLIPKLLEKTIVSAASTTTQAIRITIAMTTINTSELSQREALAALSSELNRFPLLILLGPQGSGKTTLAIELIDSRVGAIFEGRVRSSQPVILLRRDAMDTMRETMMEHRKLPIDGMDGPIYVDVSMYDALLALIEGVFDVMELGEDVLVSRIIELTKGVAEVEVIEVVADSGDAMKRRMKRHEDAAKRLETLLRKEKEFGVKSNIWGIQGARVGDIILRDSVSPYLSNQIARTPEDFHELIPTQGLDLNRCLREMIRIAETEARESGFLVLHRRGEQKVISDILVGSSNAIIGVTMLELYVGYRQKRQGQQAYVPDIDEGTVELIHSHLRGDCKLSDADRGGAERFGIIVSVVEPNGGVDSTNEARKEELRQILWW